MSAIRDPHLAPSGWEKIRWVQGYMPVLNRLAEEFRQSRPLEGQRVAVCLHLEAKTAYMLLVLQAAGAQVAAAASNPLSTQDDVVAALDEAGVSVYAWREATSGEYHRHLQQAAAHQPTLVVDDGGDLVALLHQEMPQHLPQVLGGSEETTTGLHRLRAMARDEKLDFPMLAVNDAHCKYLFDNRYGTGQSVWDGILRATNLVIAGKTAVVSGYGWCGKGVALRARGLGASVIVTEVDPVRALEAHMDGLAVMPLYEAACRGEVFVTVTGCNRVLTAEHFQRMPHGAILANAGHFDIEVDKEDLRRLGGEPRRSRDHVDTYTLEDGKQLHLLGEGRLVNLAAADGHPAEIMDMSFALQSLALEHLALRGRELGPGVWPLPGEIDRRVAWMKLEGTGLDIDTLNSEQERYLKSWEV